MKRISVFFCIHFFIIIILSIYLFLDSILDSKKDFPIVSFLKKDVFDSNYIRPYLVFTGINTGYGFYGVNVATNKFFLIEILDKKNNIIKKINVSDFKTKNSFSRFHTLPSWLYNFKVETKELKDKGLVSKNDEKYIKLRDEYVKKVNKHILNSYINKNELNKEFTYVIKLITVVPPDIWNNNLEKNNIYVLETNFFKSKDLF